MLAVKNISMTACVGNYFRLAFLPLLRKITECGNYCEASLDLEPVLLSAGARSRQLQRRLCAWPGTLLGTGIGPWASGTRIVSPASSYKRGLELR